MVRLSASVAFMCAALALTAPIVRADETFHLQLSQSGLGDPGGSGTITLASDPGSGTFLFSNYNPTVAFSYSPYTFTQADIFNPATAQFVLSDFNGQRRLQLLDSTGGFVTFEKNLGNGNFFDVNFRSDTYGTSAEIGSPNYSALTVSSADVPEPGSMAGLAAAVLTGAVLLRKRRASRSR